MEVLEEVKIIPEHEIKLIHYVAFDGKCFSSSEECQCYETWRKYYLDKQSLPVFRRSRDTIIYPDELPATMYYISSDRDYDDLMNYVNGVKIQDDYPKFGPGFYLYVEESGGDSKDSYRLHFLDHYINLIRIDIDNWLHDLSEARSSIEDNLKNEVQS